MEGCAFRAYIPALNGEVLRANPINLYNRSVEDLIRTLTLYALPVLLAITLHEAAHGYVAKLFGDPTASLAGRVSLNPIRHIDPIGTIAVPVGILAMSSLFGGGFLFGWAKPVPVDFGRLHLHVLM